MKTQELYDSILDLLPVIRGDKEKLMKVLTFLEDQVLETERKDDKKDLTTKYDSVIMQIADALNSGQVSFLNPKTFEIEKVDRKASNILDNEAYEEQHDDMMDEYGLNYATWDSYVKFEPFRVDEWLLIMADFANQVDDETLSSELEQVLGGETPLAGFKNIIEKSDKEALWNIFKKQQIINAVRDKLLLEVR